MYPIKKGRYKKVILLIFAFILAYIIFYFQDTNIIKDTLSSLDYVGTFIAGILFAYGFTTAPAVSVLLIMSKSQNIWVASTLAALGAIIGSSTLFMFIRNYLSDEIKKIDGKIEHEKWIHNFLKVIPHKMKKTSLIILAGIILAIPIPDEIAISLLAITKGISLRVFIIISFIFSFLGIFLVLNIGRLI